MNTLKSSWTAPVIVLSGRRKELQDLPSLPGEAWQAGDGLGAQDLPMEQPALPLPALLLPSLKQRGEQGYPYGQQARAP